MNTRFGMKERRRQKVVVMMSQWWRSRYERKTKGWGLMTTMVVVMVGPQMAVVVETVLVRTVMTLVTVGERWI
ncbi:transmembrane protein, putative [Medicago truncatula]|uniref:Transmembrane protein, putative n=1 Tax=Medicago truncatula TaxID=3880 RepID=A0A072VNL9_MEDTR|nr:transmembrane protein, putative [Medicago truncatula]